MKTINKGIRIAKKYGFKLFPRFFDLLYLLDNWSDLKNMAYNYNYHEKSFTEIFRKYNENVGMVNVCWINIHIIKYSDRYKVIVHNVDGKLGSKVRYLLKKFLLGIFTFEKGKVYLRDVLIKSSTKTHRLIFEVRKVDLVKVMSLLNYVLIRYYPGKRLRGNIILGKSVNSDSLYVITEINGKKSSYYLKRMGKMPKLNRIALRNRKIQYQFFKLLLNKGILIPDDNSFLVVYMPFRLSKAQQSRSFWRFSPIYLFNEKRMRANFNTVLWNPVLVDYDYDETNQVLLKFADEMHRSILCGLDYKNTLWCIELPPITIWWRIKNVYKYVYDLDEKTKVFNF